MKRCLRQTFCKHVWDVIEGRDGIYKCKCQKCGKESYRTKILSKAIHA